jgi:choice-of-anchor C domain-containing protein
VKRRPIVGAALAFVASMSLAGSAFAFTGASNGSFEDGTFTADPFDTLVPGDTRLTGWTVESGSVDWIGSYWQASAGSRSIDLTGVNAGAISQTLTTTIGNTYVVTFDLSGNPAGPPITKTLTVSATGGPTAGYAFDTGAAGNTLTDMKWAPQTYSFLATSTSSVVTFTSTTDGFWGPALDNVAVTEDVATVADCKNGGWETMVDSQANEFKNQGDCVSFFATKGKNLGSVVPVTAAAPAPAATDDASHSSVADVKRAAVKRPANTHVRTHENTTKVQAHGSATKGQASGAAGHH